MWSMTVEPVGHAAESVCGREAMEECGASKVSGENDSVRRIASVVAEGAIDEVGLGECELGAAIPLAGVCGGGLVAVGAVDCEVGAGAGLEAVVGLIGAHVAGQCGGPARRAGQVAGVAEGGDLVPRESAEWVVVVELACVEAQGVACVGEVAGDALLAARDTPLLLGEDAVVDDIEGEVYAGVGHEIGLVSVVVPAVAHAVGTGLVTHE